MTEPRTRAGGDLLMLYARHWPDPVVATVDDMEDAICAIEREQYDLLYDQMVKWARRAEAAEAREQALREAIASALAGIGAINVDDLSAVGLVVAISRQLDEVLRAALGEPTGAER